ncbi:FecCD family ABC transporter permease [Actinotignum sp. GS-2025f]|uniref:FecCD family ABC transporter permease n=1 Tax=Actinotignum TaxID=1653174 RepID=UPI002A814E45|nr:MULTISPECIES: iron ABC transporter permease [Actinotignum]MDY5128195.1 iron ABC transporter permease [Actinotignum sp. SLA_B059]MDY5145294.1 iron ABC transporter permease [Actinotignum timonense]
MTLSAKSADSAAGAAATSAAAAPGMMSTTTAGASAPAPAASTPTTAASTIARRRTAAFAVLVITTIALLGAMVVAMGMGQLSISAPDVVRILLSSPDDVDRSALVAINQIRAPRVILAVVLGGCLAVSGAVLQSLFRNPLVSPDIVGVSSAAAFGGVLAILVGTSSFILMGSTFIFGLSAVVCVMLIGRIRSHSATLTIVLAGVVVSAFFNAMVSLMTYVADPYSKLPSITFWLMGSLAAASWAKVTTIIIPVIIGLIVVVALRWRINVLSLGDEDARALGINPSAMRWVCIFAVALLTAASVAAAGIIGWVGLVIPHLVRLLVGHDNRVVIPESFLMGGMYLLIIDTIARNATSVEIPVGILTATIGAPVFIGLLIRRARKGRALA